MLDWISEVGWSEVDSLATDIAMNQACKYKPSKYFPSSEGES